MHFRFDLFLERDLSVLENLVYVRAQLARGGIDDREFFLDPQSVNVIFPRLPRSGRCGGGIILPKLAATLL
jgi:hypothetical protein